MTLEDYFVDRLRRRRSTGRTWAARLHERRKRRLARRAAAGDVARRGLPPRPGSGW